MRRLLCSIFDPSNKQTALHHAVWLNHEQIVEFLLERRSDPNTRDQDRGTPLHAASWNGHQRIVELLLARRAEINARDATGRTPAHAAASNGHVRVLQHLSDVRLAARQEARAPSACVDADCFAC